jgi:hypothetical protein
MEMTISSTAPADAEFVDIHTHAEVSAEVERLRRNTVELAWLVALGIIRPWFLEADLRVEAYNRLTDKMCAAGES